jgi:hypothetical protein
MKEIILKIEDKVLKDMRSEVFARCLCHNDGFTDQILGKIINAIEDEKTEVELRYKRKGE